MKLEQWALIAFLVAFALLCFGHALAERLFFILAAVAATVAVVLAVVPLLS